VTTDIAKQEAEENRPNYEVALKRAKSRFIEILGGDTRTWDSESIFAMQHICKSEFSINTANRNPMSVQLAMYNAASTGLTLNPANGYAYLIPRDGAIRLDISYKGLIKIATDTGSVEWARAEVVHEKDTFEYNGPAEKPTHKANPFSKDRGEIIGVYCIAKVASGDVLTEVMDLDEIEKVRGKSDAWAKKKAGPWAEWFSEMCRKAVIKRAQKTWPYTEKSVRLAKAIEIANESEGGYIIDGQCKREEPDEKAAEWIRRAQAIKHMGEYDREYEKLVSAYGGVNKVPVAVKLAFTTAHAEVMPRDEEPAQ
jgi:recombination protein RecT